MNGKYDKIEEYFPTMEPTMNKKHRSESSFMLPETIVKIIKKNSLPSKQDIEIYPECEEIRVDEISQYVAQFEKNLERKEEFYTKSLISLHGELQTKNQQGKRLAFQLQILKRQAQETNQNVLDLLQKAEKRERNSLFKKTSLHKPNTRKDSEELLKSPRNVSDFQKTHIFHKK